MTSPGLLWIYYFLEDVCELFDFFYSMKLKDLKQNQASQMILQPTDETMLWMIASLACIQFKQLQ